MQVKHLVKVIVASNTAERLTDDATLYFRGTGTLAAASGNSAVMYVGGSAVSPVSHGVALNPIDSVGIPICSEDGLGTQLNSIWVYGTAGNVITLLYGR